MRKLILLKMAALLWATSLHGAVVLTGSLNDPLNTALKASDLSAPLFGDDFEIANNIALHEVVVASAGPWRFLSTGFAAGGVDPYFSIFLGSGNTATFLASNFAQAFSTGGDFDLTIALAAGTYTFAVGAFANLSFAENLGVGSLGDGFTGLGGPGFLANSFYSIEAGPSDTAVPEPSLVGLVCVAIAVWIRRLTISRPTTYKSPWQSHTPSPAHPSTPPSPPPASGPSSPK